MPLSALSYYYEEDHEVAARFVVVLILVERTSAFVPFRRGAS
jgi:hypothetical protein